MDFQSLRVFLKAAELGSFSQAGERLHLTQPAVSKRVAGLENELGARLFDRIGRQVQLTEAGRRLRPRARRLLDEMQDIRRELGNLSGGVSGTLVVGTSHHIGLHRLPPVLKDYAREFPDVRLDLRFQDSESVCADVEKGGLELGIVTLPPAPLPRLNLEPLWEDPMHIAVAKDHPLAGDPSPGLALLTRYPAVLPAAATYTRDILEQAVARQGLELNVGMSTNYLETLKMLAVTGLGWAMLPATMLDADLVTLDLQGLELSRRLGMVRHERRTLSNAACAMQEVCRRHGDSA